MSEESRRMARGAAAQWNTLEELILLSSDVLDEETLRTVQSHVTSAQHAVDRCSSMSEVGCAEDLNRSLRRVRDAVKV